RSRPLIEFILRTVPPDWRAGSQGLWRIREVTMSKAALSLSMGLMIGVASVPSALAQQVTGAPGSPGATTTIDGKQLPPPDPKFGGVIREKASESTPWWPPRITPPKGAPNVLLIMIDDNGYGAHGTFGGV